MFYRCLVISFGIVSLCMSVQLRAEESSFAKSATCQPSITLDNLQALALRNSPHLAEFDSEYTSASSKAFEVETLANPELQAEHVYTTMDINGDNDPQANVSIAQRLKLSNLGQRGKVAELIRRMGDTQKRARLIEFTQKLSLQFHTLRTLQQSEMILIDAERLASKKVTLVHQGVEKGLLSEGDHKLFEGEKYRLQAQRRGLQGSISAVQGEISKAVGVICNWSASSELTIEPLPSEQELLALARQSSLSEVARADLLSELASEELRLAELDRYPEFAPRIVYQHTNDGGDFIGAGISIPLPFFNRNQGDISRTQAAYRAAQKRQELFAQGGLEMQVRSLRNTAAAAIDQAHLYSTKVVPSYEAALRSQERIYSQGKGNVLQVWQTLRLFNEARSEALAIQLAAITTRIQLSLLVGEVV
jgi:cobalt-zinc-cadmium efflux system outer membrane protein